MKNILIAALVVIFCGAFISSDQKYNTIFIVAKDDVKITADLYFGDEENEFIVLCHQAGYSRGEFRETALTFLEMGYNCLAVDLRSGKICNDVINETNTEANSKGFSTNYLDAKQDMIDAINFIYTEYDQKSILLGSSYSASLALIIGKQEDNAKAVIAFSPGEYFKGDDVIVADEMKSLSKPTFLAGASSELNQLEPFYMFIENENKVMFTPMVENGDHGSKALWKDNPAHGQYWAALQDFLNAI